MKYTQIMNTTLFYFSDELNALKKKGISVDELGIKDIVLITQKKNQSIHRLGGNEENINRNLEELSKYSSYIRQFIKAGVYKTFFNDSERFELECLRVFEPESYKVVMESIKNPEETYAQIKNEIKNENKKLEKDKKEAENKKLEEEKKKKDIERNTLSMNDLKKIKNPSEAYIKQQIALALKYESYLNTPGLLGLSNSTSFELGAEYEAAIILPPNLMSQSGILAGDVFKNRSSSLGTELLVKLNASTGETRTQYTVNDNKLLKYDIIRQE